MSTPRGKLQKWVKSPAVAPDVALVSGTWVAQAALAVGGESLQGRRRVGTFSLDLHFDWEGTGASAYLVKVERTAAPQTADAKPGPVEIFTTSHNDDVATAGVGVSLLKEHTYTKPSGTTLDEYLEWTMSDAPATLIVWVKVVSGTVKTGDGVQSYLGA